MITNIIIRTTSLNGATFKESLDLGLVCAAFDHQVNLIFLGEGIFNLIAQQSNSKLKDKNQLGILKGLEFYDIDNIMVEKESLDDSRVNLSKLIPQTKVVNRSILKQLNLSANHLVEL